MAPLYGFGNNVFCLLICTELYRSLDGLKDLAASQAPKLKKNETEADFVRLKCKEYEKTNRELEVKELKIIIIVTRIIRIKTLHCYVLKIKILNNYCYSRYIKANCSWIQVSSMTPLSRNHRSVPAVFPVTVYC